MLITLTGTNDYLIRQALDTMKEQFVSKFGVHSIERANGEQLEPARLGELLQGASLFALERLVVLRDAAKNKPLWEALADQLDRIPAETTLVVVEQAPDKRTKTYKQLVKISEVRELNNLGESALIGWLRQTAKTLGGTIDAKTAAYLLQQVGTDQWRLLHELEKLVNYRPDIHKAAIDDLVEATPQASVFELLDGTLGRQPAVVKRLLSRLALSEDPYKLFGLLTAQVHALAVVSSAGDKPADTIAKEAALHPFVVRKTQSLAGSLRVSELKDIITAIAQCDSQLKSTGVNPWTLLEQCFNKLATR